MERSELEDGARRILLSNLRQGVAGWNGREYSFVCPSLTGYPFQWFWDSCFHALALIHLETGPSQGRAAHPDERGSAQRYSCPISSSGRWRSSRTFSAATSSA